MTRIADIEIPDSKLAIEATELVRDLTDDLIYHHSRRVFLFGSLQGRELKYDPELLYVGAMFHDLGLTDTYRDSVQRFEIDGADAAADFLRQRGISDADAELVWTGIALHTTPEIPHHLRPRSNSSRPVSRPTYWASPSTASPPRPAPRSSPRTRAPTSRTRSWRPSPRASSTARRPPSATSRPTSWPATSPVSSRSTSSTPSSTRPGRSTVLPRRAADLVRVARGNLGQQRAERAGRHHPGRQVPEQMPGAVIGIAILIPPGGNSIRCSTYACIRSWYAGNARRWLPSAIASSLAKQ